MDFECLNHHIALFACVSRLAVVHVVQSLLREVRLWLVIAERDSSEGVVTVSCKGAVIVWDMAGNSLWE